MELSERETSPYEKNKNSADHGTSSEPKVITFVESAKAIALTGSLNALLLCLPIAIISYGAKWPDAVTFVFSLLALAPLAERLGYVTENLAFHTNETIGGLLNATFGNATELIVAVTALIKGLYRLVQLSLLGSILSNMLLVLGTAFMLGGSRYKTQNYGRISAQVNATLLMLAVMGVLFPTILSNSNYESNLGLLGLSRATALILFGIYFAFLYFQLFSHSHLYEDEEESMTSEGSVTPKTPSSNGGVISQLHASSPASDLEQPLTDKQNDEDKAAQSTDDDEEEEVDELGFTNALIWLAVITALIAVLSEAISDSIQDAADSAGVSGVFIAAILLPIVGNAAEHAGAIMFAMKGKVDLTLGVAVGSSTQIALCVLPLLVIIGWMANKDLSLDFGGFEGSALFLSVVSVTFVLKDGSSNWLLGAALVGAYLIISVAFWTHLNEPLDS